MSNVTEVFEPFFIQINEGESEFREEADTVESITLDDESNMWLEIKPLDDTGELPSIDPMLVPPSIRDLALSSAEHFQVDFTMSFFCALACLATAVQGKYAVEVKQDYLEPLNVYLMVTAEPSELKSPTLKLFRKPAEDWLEEKNLKEQEEIKAKFSENQTLKKLIEAKRAQVMKSKNDESIQTIMDEVKALEERLHDIRTYTRLFADDITPESLGNVLEQQGGQLAILEAEGGFFGTIAGRYSGMVNLDIILKAYNRESVRIDRKGKPTVTIRNPHLTLLFLIQPYLLVNREKGDAFKGRGLDARFLYAIPKSKVGYRTFESQAIDEKYVTTYDAMIKSYLDMILESNEPYILRMTTDAQQYYVEFMNVLEESMRSDGELEHMRDWAGKKGHLARLLGLLHCAQYIQPQDYLVQLDEVQNACAIMTVLIAHAKRAYGFMGDREELKIAKKLHAWIQTSGKIIFSAKESFDGIRGQIKRQEEVDKGLQLLVDHNYIKKLPIERSVGRPSIKYEVNPQFWRK